MEDDKKLKPCPFCGGHFQLLHSFTGLEHRTTPCCYGCGVAFNTICRATLEEAEERARELVNRRPK